MLSSSPSSPNSKREGVGGRERNVSFISFGRIKDTAYTFFSERRKKARLGVREETEVTGRSALSETDLTVELKPSRKHS